MPLDFKRKLSTRGKGNSFFAVLTLCSLGLTSHFKGLAHLKLANISEGTYVFKIIQFCGSIIKVIITFLDNTSK